MVPEYTIQSGDTLTSIGQPYGLTGLQLYNLRDSEGRPNRDRLRSGDPDLIYPGEVIWVPGEEEEEEEEEEGLVWPSNEREPRKVSHGYGDSEEMPPYNDREFHHGTDIPGDNRTQIIAVTSGCLWRIYGHAHSGSGDGCILEPDSGGDQYVYAHVTARPGRPIPNTRGSAIRVGRGDHILNLHTDPPINWIEPAHVCDHLHFQIGFDPNTGLGAVRNPLQDLETDPDEHDVSVEISQFRYVRLVGDTGPVRYLTETSPVVADAPILRSGIVIIVDGEDNMGYNNWTPGVHKLEYEVMDGNDENVIDPMELFEWVDTLPANQHYRVIYNMGPRPCQTTFHFNYYVVTNTNNNDPINNDDFNQWWNTKAREAGSAGNGVGARDAGLNSQAFFPDGRYTVKVTGYDINEDSDSDEKLVILDNFKPYVKRVIVKAGEDVKYDASWPETSAGSVGAITRDPDDPCERGTLTFEVYFSETMDIDWSDFRVEIQPSGSSDWINVSDNMSWDRENFDDDKWTGEVTLPSDAGEGEAQIRIRARDLAGNELDTDPQTVAEFDRTSNSWSDDNPGSDENHRITIEAARGSFTATLHPRGGSPPP